MKAAGGVQVQVGTFDIVCPDCLDVIALPVWCWLIESNTGMATNAEVDNDPMWEHSLLTHPQVH